MSAQHRENGSSTSAIKEPPPALDVAVPENSLKEQSEVPVVPFYLSFFVLIV
jgi:hypothetical protein